MEENFNTTRYELAIERIAQIKKDRTVKVPYRDFFEKTADFIIMIDNLKKLRIEENSYENMTIEQCKKENTLLYEDVIGKAYEKSYANPTFAVEQLGNEYGKMLSFLYTEIRSVIAYVFEKRIEDITIRYELFIEIYNCFEEEDSYTYKNSKKIIYDFMSDYSEIIVKRRLEEMLDENFSFALDIIEKEDLSDLRYLYKFGEYISENEIETAKYLNSLSENKIIAMASTFTEGFKQGFKNNNIDMSKKKVVNIRYSLGFERIVREEIKQFKDMGLETTIYRAALSSVNKKQNLKIGYYGSCPNKQYDYDHRFDDSIYLDKGFVERKLENLKKAYEELKEKAKVYAGPAVMEIFGEETFEPENKEESLKLDEKQQKLSVLYQREASIITNEYIKSDEYSFTIIAYPIPEIGKQYKQIFDDTVIVNTLDVEMYKNIQQKLIDALDKGNKVIIKGKDNNKTDLVVSLNELKEPLKETNFENCLADVNIPLGEVFTSPKLDGTNGILHVTQVYLNDLKYLNLKLTFKNGKIINYECDNFKNEDDNKKFIKENLLFNHETLPIGEFAIGTNTTAYKMGKKYGISKKLPILIAEKTGPHFAVGDTCYKMSEDLRIWNPDGKEIISKENECSKLRHTEIEKAYFNCHTDITIPYDELFEISVITKTDEKINLILDGHFVLEGTTKLNEALDS